MKPCSRRQPLRRQAQHAATPESETPVTPLLSPETAAKIESATEECWEFWEAESRSPRDQISLETTEPLRELLDGITLLVVYCLLAAAVSTLTFFPWSDGAPVPAAPAVTDEHISRVRFLLEEWTF